MPSDAAARLTLGFDTSAAHCAAALLSGDRVLGAVAEEMAKGQAERLFPLLEDLLAAHDAVWADLGRLGVGIGPGNFTGIRIAVSAARGLALSLDVPAIGVSTFDAVRLIRPGAAVAVPAPRGMIHLSRPGAAPGMVPAAQAPDAILPPPPTDLATAIARLAAAAEAGSATPPAPLYLRPADAAPPADAPPEIVD